MVLPTKPNFPQVLPANAWDWQGLVELDHCCLMQHSSKVQSLAKDFPSAWSKLSQKHTAVWEIIVESFISSFLSQVPNLNYHIKALPDNSCSLPSSFTGISTPKKEKKSQSHQHLNHVDICFSKDLNWHSENILQYLIYWQSATGLVKTQHLLHHSSHSSCSGLWISAEPRHNLTLLFKIRMSACSITLVVSNSLLPQDSPGKNTGVGCYAFLHFKIHINHQVTWVSMFTG